MGNGTPYLIKEIKGKKIGFFGLAGEDWVEILADEYEDELIYEDTVRYSKKMCLNLRKEKCDLIVALTHMRQV